MAKQTANVPTVRIKDLRVPEPVYDTYAERATKLGWTPEEEILHRLSKCRNHTAQMPIYLSDEERNEISLVAGQTIQTVDQLIKWARELATIKVEHIDVELSAQLLKRLETRRFGKTLAQLIHDLTIEQLEQYVGLR